MQRLLAYLQLCRFAAVFTAMADIVLGYLLAGPMFIESRELALLLAASSGLYLAGMVFNDLFDREIDARERPKRPIPSGRVSVRAATAFGTMLMLAGVAAAVTAGTQSAIVAALLVAAILLYDGVLKSMPVGPVAMGACRFLNVMLGASTATGDGAEPSFAAVWAHPQLHVALGLGAYIAGVTWFARKEAGQSSRGQLGGAIAVVNFGLVFLIAFVLHWPAADVDPRRWNAALLLGIIGVIINRRLIAALFDPSPGNVQASVKLMLMSIIMLDAALVFFIHDNRAWSVAVAALLVPAHFLGRFLAVT